jgi:hypothetical protein
MYTGERVVFLANCQIVQAKIQDFSLSSKVEYGSKDKIAVVTEQHVYIYNSLVSYDADEYRMVEAAIVKALEKPPSNIDFTEPPFASVKYHHKEEFVVEGTQRLRNLFKDYPSIQIESVTPTVFFVDNEARKIDVLFFQTKRDADHFARALKIGRGIAKYLKACEDRGVARNVKALRLVESMVVDPDVPALMAPELLASTNEEDVEARAICLLYSEVKCIDRLKIQYPLINTRALELVELFLDSEIKQNLRKVSMEGAQMSDDYLTKLSKMIIKADRLLELDLSSNRLTDSCFMDLTVVIQNCKFVKKVGLSHNQITLA